MNRAITRRLLNEYLDGEIGLADKAELERQMAADPALRKDYQELRRLSLLLNSQPEIIVHPFRFRRKLLSQLQAPQRLTFTPQRAFAGAMLVALLAITLTFGLVMYQEKLLGGWQPALTPAAPAPMQSNNSIKLYVPASAETFFNRLLLETQLGMVDQSALAPFLAQTSIYEGATCTQRKNLQAVEFSQPLPAVLRLTVTAKQAKTLNAIARELGDGSARLTCTDYNGEETAATLEQASHNQVQLYIEFK